MIGNIDSQSVIERFPNSLVSVIKMKHELVELAQRINWKSLEEDFSVTGKHFFFLFTLGSLRRIIISGK